MKNRQLHVFYTEIYPRTVWIASNTSRFQDVFDGVSAFEDSCDACVEDVVDKNTKKGGVLIRFRSKKYMTHEDITHESIHAAAHIFEYIGAKIDPENMEPFCYLAGWIAKCCEIVKNYKK